MFFSRFCVVMAGLLVDLVVCAMPTFEHVSARELGWREQHSGYLKEALSTRFMCVVGDNLTQDGSGGLVTPEEKRGLVSRAMGELQSKGVGLELLKNIFLKLMLRRDVIDRIGWVLDSFGEALSRNNLPLGASHLRRLVETSENAVNDVNKAVDLLKDSSVFSSFLDNLVTGKGWEDRAVAFLERSLNVPGTGAVTGYLGNIKPLCDVYTDLPNVFSFLVERKSGVIVKVEETVEGGHRCTLGDDGSVCVFINFYTFLNGEKCYFFDKGDNSLKERTVSDLDELLFHEMNHGLHAIESKGEYSTTITNKGRDFSGALYAGWDDFEEFRNMTGIVALSDGIFRDNICTEKYDEECNRKARCLHLIPPQNEDRKNAALPLVRLLAEL